MRHSIVMFYLAKALRVVGIAAFVGLLGSFAFSRALEGMLFGVSATDPVTLAAVIGIVSLVAIGAALVPAMRASRIDPIRALRQD
jgi:ABC-type antimicrobial peptide transport system permease subunit